MMTKTGRTRHRHYKTPIFGTIKLVLQFEYAGTEAVYSMGSVHMEGKRYWRDATIEDLAELAASAQVI